VGRGRLEPPLYISTIREKQTACNTPCIGFLTHLTENWNSWGVIVIRQEPKGHRCGLNNVQGYAHAHISGVLMAHSHRGRGPSVRFFFNGTRVCPDDVPVCPLSPVVRFRGGVTAEASASPPPSIARSQRGCRDGPPPRSLHREWSAPRSIRPRKPKSQMVQTSVGLRRGPSCSEVKLPPTRYSIPVAVHLDDQTSTLAKDTATHNLRQPV